MNTHLQTVVTVLGATPMCFMATSTNNTPKVRPFQFQFEKDSNLWFCTSRKKEVFAQLQANPSVQICAVKPDCTTLRVDAKVIFEDNIAIKERILAEQPLIKTLYGSADNPDFVTFHIAHGSYVIFDFSGAAPIIGTF